MHAEVKAMRAGAWESAPEESGVGSRDEEGLIIGGIAEVSLEIGEGGAGIDLEGGGAGDRGDSRGGEGAGLGEAERSRGEDRGTGVRVRFPGEDLPRPPEPERLPESVREPSPEPPKVRAAERLRLLEMLMGVELIWLH